MKKLGNIVSFALFGAVVEAILLAIVGGEVSAYAFGCAMSFFVFYRVAMSGSETKSYVAKEFRRMWIRSAPENTIAFALVSSFALVFFNAHLWVSASTSQLVVAGFFSVGLARVFFELARQAANSFGAFLAVHKRRVLEKKLLEVRSRNEDARFDKQRSCTASSSSCNT